MEIKLVTALGAMSVTFDIAQAHEDDEAKYDIIDVNGDRYGGGVVELQIGDDIPVEITREALAELEEHDREVYGLIVGEHRLATFLSRFDEYEIFYGSELNR